MDPIRYFTILGKDIVLSARQPRQAALKAASMGHTHIELRERGTKKVHVYQGQRVRVSIPEGTPWGATEAWRPKVKKIKIYYADRIRRQK